MPSEALMFSERESQSSIEGEGFSLLFDSLLVETHKMKLNVTEHPIEDGNVITDFAQPEIERISVTALVSNFGLRRGELITNNAQDAFDLLWSYKTNVVPVSLATTLHFYEDMIISNVSVKRNGKSGEAQEFNIDLQKFDIVSLETTEINWNRVRLPTKAELASQAEARKKAKNKKGNGELVRTFSDDKYSNPWIQSRAKKYGLRWGEDAKIENLTTKVSYTGK